MIDGRRGQREGEDMSQQPDGAKEYESDGEARAKMVET